MHSTYAGILAGGPELLIIVAVIALLFGSAQIPKFARSLGQAKQEFEKGNSEEPAVAPVLSTPPPASNTHVVVVERSE